MATVQHQKKLYVNINILISFITEYNILKNKK